MPSIMGVSGHSRLCLEKQMLCISWAIHEGAVGSVYHGSKKPFVSAHLMPALRLYGRANREAADACHHEVKGDFPLLRIPSSL